MAKFLPAGEVAALAGITVAALNSKGARGAWPRQQCGHQWLYSDDVATFTHDRRADKGRDKPKRERFEATTLVRQGGVAGGKATAARVYTTAHGSQQAPTVTPPGEDHTEHRPEPHRPAREASDADRRYYSEVDTDGRRVICYLPMLRRPVVLSFETDAALHSGYSQTGSGMTIRELADRYGWTVEVTRAILRARGITHASLPWADWDIAERGDDAIVDDAKALHRQRLLARFDRERVESLKRAEANQTRIEVWASAVVAQLTGHVTSRLQSGGYATVGSGAHPVVPDASQTAQPPALIVDAMTDVHIDRLGADGSGWRQTYDAVITATRRLIDRTCAAYQPDRVVLLAGSDWFDADTHAGTTTNGTRQFRSLPPEQAIARGIDLLIERVAMWSLVAPVEVIAIPGNHDRMVTTVVGVLLRHLMQGSSRVKVHTCGEAGRIYLRHGSVLLGFRHGDGAREGELPGIMADEAPDQGGVRWRYWIEGHRHHTATVQKAGGTIMRAPAMATASGWEAFNFGSHHRAAHVHAYGAGSGYLGTICETG